MKDKVIEGKILKDGKFYSTKDIIELTEKQAKEFVESGKLQKVEEKKDGKDESKKNKK